MSPNERVIWIKCLGNKWIQLTLTVYTMHHSSSIERRTRIDNVRENTVRQVKHQGKPTAFGRASHNTSCRTNNHEDLLSRRCGQWSDSGEAKQGLTLRRHARRGSQARKLRTCVFHHTQDDRSHLHLPWPKRTKSTHPTLYDLLEITLKAGNTAGNRSEIIGATETRRLPGDWHSRRGRRTNWSPDRHLPYPMPS